MLRIYQGYTTTLISDGLVALYDGAFLSGCVAVVTRRGGTARYFITTGYEDRTAGNVGVSYDAICLFRFF